jgi:Tfp pilus assembly protein PilN
MSARPLQLDYAAPPRRLPWPGLAVLILAVAVAAALTLHYRDIRNRLAFLQAAHGLQSPAQAPARAASAAQIDEEQKQVGLVVRQLTLPWAGMIEALEHASGDDVALLQLQPDVQQRVLRVTAQARDSQAMLEYLRRLAQNKVFSDVHLVSHRVQQDDPQHPVQFVAQALFGGGP